MAGRRADEARALAARPACGDLEAAARALCRQAPAQPGGGGARAGARPMETPGRGPAGGSRRAVGRPGGRGGRRPASPALIDESEGLPPVTRAQFADLVEACWRARRCARGGAQPSAPAHPGRAGGAPDPGRPADPGRAGGGRVAAGRGRRSRSCRGRCARRCGLPPPERRIGLSAHDFAQAAGAPRGGPDHHRAARRGAGVAVALALAAADPGQGRRSGHARACRTCWPGRAPWTRRWPRQPPRRAARHGPSRRSPPGRASCRSPPSSSWVRDPYAIYARYVLRPAAAGAARRAGRGAGARDRRSTRPSSASRANDPDARPADAERLFADLVVEELLRAGMPSASVGPRARAGAPTPRRWVIDFERDGARARGCCSRQHGEHDVRRAGRPLHPDRARRPHRGARRDAPTCSTSRPAGRRPAQADAERASRRS